LLEQDFISKKTSLEEDCQQFSIYDRCLEKYVELEMIDAWICFVMDWAHEPMW
jgi:hypothetical protein